MKDNCRTWLVAAAAAGVLAGCNFRSEKMRTDPNRARVDARDALLQAVEDPNPHAQTKALEALARTEGASAGPTMIQLLRSDSAPVQFAAAMAIGDTRYAPAKPVLLELAQGEAVPTKFMIALIYALHNVGDDTHTKELGRLLYHSDKWVRATAAMVMGKLGEPSAKGPLKAVQGDDHDPVVQLQIVEALARLGDERSIVLLEAFTKSQYMEDRIIAVQGMGYLNTPRSIDTLRRIAGDSAQDATVRVAAVGSLARLKQREGYNLALRAATEPVAMLRKARGRDVEISRDEVVNLQCLGILALGDLGNPLAVDALHPLLRDPDGAVRVAAGEAVLMLLSAQRPPAAAPAEPTSQPASRPALRPKLHAAGGKD